LRFADGATNRAIASLTWTKPWLEGVPEFDYGGGFTSGVSATPIEHLWTCPQDGEYSITFTGALVALTVGQSMGCRILLNAAVFVRQEYTYTGTVAAIELTISTGLIRLFAGDLVECQIIHNDTIPQVINDAGCKLSITQISDRNR